MNKRISVQQHTPNQITSERSMVDSSSFQPSLSPSILTPKYFAKLLCPPPQASASYHQLLAGLLQQPPTVSTHTPFTLPPSVHSPFLPKRLQKATLVSISPSPNKPPDSFPLALRKTTKGLTVIPYLLLQPYLPPNFLSGPVILLPIPSSHRLIHLQRMNVLSSTSSLN